MSRRVRRVAVDVGLVIAVVVALASLQTISERDTLNDEMIGDSGCFARSYLLIEAQAVPSAQLLPCVVNDLDGWSLPTETYTNGRAEVVLTSADTGSVTWTLTITPSCVPDAAATQVTPSGSGYTQLARTTNADGLVTRSQWYQFTGGCLTSVVEVPERYNEQRIFDEVDSSIVLIERSLLDDYVRQRNDGHFGLDPA